MNIQLSNRAWIRIEKDKYGYDISANDNNGNSVEICNISEKYIKQFQKNLNKLINNME